MSAFIENSSTHLTMAFLVLLLFSLCCIVSGQGDTCKGITYSSPSGREILRSSTFEDNKPTYLEFKRNKNYEPDVHMLIKIHKLTLSEENGDLLIVGPGNCQEVFSGSPSLMYVESQDEIQDILVMGKSVTVIFVTRKSSPHRYLEIEWKLNGTETENEFTTQAPTTAVSKADMKAVILCFKHGVQLTCGEFEKKEENFKRALVNRVTVYTDQKKMDVKKILLTDIKVRCRKIDSAKNGTRENNFLTVTITDSRNPDLPVFTTQELREIIKDFNHNDSLGVAECRSYPNYWWWVWGSTIMLGIVIVILAVCWGYSIYEARESSFGKEKGPSDTKQCNGIVNDGFLHDEKMKEFYCDEPISTPDAIVKLDEGFRNSPETPKRKAFPAFPMAESPTSKFNNVPPFLSRASTKNLIPITEDTIRESAPSLASEDFTLDPPEARKLERESSGGSRSSQHVYEDLDKYRDVQFRPPRFEESSNTSL